MDLPDVIIVIRNISSTYMQINWENLEKNGTHTQITHKLGKCLNYLDYWVHSFPVAALDRQELTKCSILYMVDIFVDMSNISAMWRMLHLVSSCVSRAVTGNEWTLCSRWLRHFPSLWEMWVWVSSGSNFLS